MFGFNRQPKTEKKAEKKKTAEEEYGDGSWFFRYKGTTAEPWPTAKQLFEDEKLKRDIENLKQLVKLGSNTTSHNSRKSHGDTKS